MEINGHSISGTSKHIADWSSAGFDMSKGTNFIAIHYKANITGSTLTCECVPNQGTPTASFTDDDAIMQIKSTTTGIKVKETNGGSVVHEEIFDISGLTLETE